MDYHQKNHLQRRRSSLFNCHEVRRLQKNSKFQSSQYYLSLRLNKIRFNKFLNTGDDFIF